MQNLNAVADKGICHSHDYIDANETMLEAMQAVCPELSRRDENDDKRIAMWNAAWAYAMTHGLGQTPEVEAAARYADDRETFEAAGFEYNEAREVWHRDTQDEVYSVEVEWLDTNRYLVTASPYTVTKPERDLGAHVNAAEAIAAADAFAPGAVTAAQFRR